MAWMPGTNRQQRFSGNRHKAKIDKLVVHTTEGSSWPGYNGGKNAPHFTFHRKGEIRQHIDTAFSAKALVNRSGGVETNNDGVLQVESIGSCDRAYAKKHGLFFWPDATDDDLMPLAKIIAWAHKEYDLPLTTRGLKFVDTNIAYATAPGRMTFAEWRSFSGICGHQHVPENHHWDPGKMPVQRAIDLAKGLLGGTTTDPNPEAEYAALDDTQRWLNDLGYGPLVIDGVFGSKTAAATLAAQQDLDITPADGRPGPATRTHLEAAVSKIDDIHAWLEPINRGGKKITVRQEIADAKTAALAAREQTGPIYRDGKEVTLRQEVADAKTLALAAEARDKAILAAIQTAASNGTEIDLDAVTAAAEKGVSQALDSLEVTVTKSAD